MPGRLGWVVCHLQGLYIDFMNEPNSDLHTLLRNMNPVLNDGVFVFASLPIGTDISMLDAVATVREYEGITVVMKEELAAEYNFPVLFRAAWITLAVQSDLSAGGLTAAFSHALAQAGISCNVVAGAYHDHLFVPAESAREAMAVLRDIQQ